jgi:hypothetical protein
LRCPTLIERRFPDAREVCTIGVEVTTLNLVFAGIELKPRVARSMPRDNELRWEFGAGPEERRGPLSGAAKKSGPSPVRDLVPRGGNIVRLTDAKIVAWSMRPAGLLTNILPDGT